MIPGFHRRRNAERETAKSDTPRTWKSPIAWTLVAAYVGFAAVDTSVIGLRAAQATEPTHTVWSAVYTEAQAKRGEAIYERECGHCHGQSLGGDGVVPPLIGETFMTTWEGLTVGDLFERIRISMPADNPGKLPAQQNADVIAYMLKIGAFPAGEQELPTKLDLLKQIVMTAHEPADPQ